MKKELLLTLPLAALLAMPAVAQQAPASDSKSPASNTQIQSQPAGTSTSPDQQTSNQASPDQGSSASDRQPLTYETR